MGQLLSSADRATDRFGSVLPLASTPSTSSATLAPADPSGASSAAGHVSTFTARAARQLTAALLYFHSGQFAQAKIVFSQLSLLDWTSLPLPRAVSSLLASLCARFLLNIKMRQQEIAYEDKEVQATISQLADQGYLLAKLERVLAWKSKAPLLQIQELIRLAKQILSPDNGLSFSSPVATSPSSTLTASTPVPSTLSLRDRTFAGRVLYEAAIVRLALPDRVAKRGKILDIPSAFELLTQALDLGYFAAGYALYQEPEASSFAQKRNILLKTLHCGGWSAAIWLVRLLNPVTRGADEHARLREELLVDMGPIAAQNLDPRRCETVNESWLSLQQCKEVFKSLKSFF